MRLLIARHGATANNAQARYTGQSNVALSPLGERQAEALAEALATEPLDAIVTSDLRRARQTTAPIARYHDVPLHEDADLRELAMGEWEGRTHDEILASEPEAVARWQEDSLNNAPPGGESVLALRDRLVRSLVRWHAAYPDGTLLWVTHGGAIGVLLCHLLGMDLDARWQFRRDNAALTELEVGVYEFRNNDRDPYLYSIIMRLNDTHHLAGIELRDEGERHQVL